MATKEQKTNPRRGGPMRGRLDLEKLSKEMGIRLAIADSNKERSRRIEEMERFADRKDKKALRKRIMRRKPRVGVDTHLERIADGMLKEDRLKQKAHAKRLRYLKNNREKQTVAKYYPTETMKKIREERGAKAVLKNLASKERIKFQRLTSTHSVWVGSDKAAALKARRLAKIEGRAAGVSIAKARVAKRKKTPITQRAIALNATAKSKMNAITEARRTAVKEARKLSARKFRSETGLKKKTAKRDYRIADALEKRGKVDQYLPYKKGSPDYTVESYRGKADFLGKLSKDQARISGGLATSVKRNAESAIAKIARGKQYKAAARLGGALGMVALFNAALGGKKKDKRG